MGHDVDLAPADPGSLLQIDMTDGTLCTRVTLASQPSGRAGSPTPAARRFIGSPVVQGRSPDPDHQAAPGLRRWLGNQPFRRTRRAVPERGSERLRALAPEALQPRAHRGLWEPHAWGSGARGCRLAEELTHDDRVYTSGSQLKSQRAVLSAGLIKMDTLLPAVS